MKTKKHFLKTIAKSIAWFAIIAGILAIGATLAVLLAFQASRTPWLVFGGAACLALLFFGARAAIKYFKGKVVADFLSKTMAGRTQENDSPIQSRVGENLPEIA